MNPESLLHEAASLLHAEAKQGPGTMFLLPTVSGFIVTRTPIADRLKDIIARFDCTDFEKGLTAPQWCRLLKKVADAHKPIQKGGASGT